MTITLSPAALKLWRETFADAVQRKDLRLVLIMTSVAYEAKKRVRQ